MELYQLFFYVPESHLEIVKNAVFAVGAGKLHEYSECSWQVKGEGQFRPLPGSRSYLGEVNKLEKVTEYKVEIICPENLLSHAIAALKAAHPYEIPAYGLIKIYSL